MQPAGCNRGGLHPVALERCPACSQLAVIEVAYILWLYWRGVLHAAS